MSLPSDCRRVRTLRHADSVGGSIGYIAPGAFSSYNADTRSRPRYYTTEAGGLALSPVPDGAYTLEIVYTQGVPALSDAAPTNDILTRHPDLYLHATLMQVHDYALDDPRADRERQRFTELAAEVHLENERVRFGASPLVIRSPYREVR